MREAHHGNRGWQELPFLRRAGHDYLKEGAGKKAKPCLFLHKVKQRGHFYDEMRLIFFNDRAHAPCFAGSRDASTLKVYLWNAPVAGGLQVEPSRLLRAAEGAGRHMNTQSRHHLHR